MLRQQQGVHFIALVAQRLHHTFGCLPLRLAAVEDAAAVLLADVGTHSVGLGRVVYLEKELAKAFVGDGMRVELHDYRLHMVGLVVTHIGIRRERFAAARVAGNGAQHAALLLKLVLSAPEAAQAKMPVSVLAPDGA